MGPLHATAITTHEAPIPMAAGKRKSPSDDYAHVESLKKRRTAETRNPKPSPTSPYMQVYNPILDTLKSKYEVKVMSVIPSTSINKHIDKALQHLSRFSAWDQKVLPGTVLLCAKSTTSNKLITIAELIRRRIGETEQKWYQYNVLSETICEEPALGTAEDHSVAEETIMAVDGEEDDEEEAPAFETMRLKKTIHELAVEPPKIRYQAYMTVLLSRVPLEELRNIPSVSLQTNEQHVEQLRKKKAGLVG